MGSPRFGGVPHEGGATGVPAREMNTVWEDVAGWWQEKFTDGADPEYVEQILPLVAEDLDALQPRVVLDVGTGEGQIARLAALRGSVVVGVDPATAQLTEATARGEGPSYVAGAASHLPLRSGTVDAVIACLVFEHIEDVDAAIAEVGRALRSGGWFMFLLNHPLLQTPGSGWIDDHILEEQYWRIGPYLVEDTTEEEVDPGVFIPFVHRPLSRYVNAMASSGMLVSRMEEPAPPPGFLARAHEYTEAASIPRLLYLRAVKT